MELYIDGDACPVKEEVIKVAERHQLKVYIVGNAWSRLGRHPLVEAVVVPPEPDAADDWIAEHIQSGDLAITADVPLAARCVERGARALAPNGRPFDEKSMGMALAMRDLMTHLRETGEAQSNAPAFTKQDRSRFLSALDQAVRAGKR